MSLFSLLTVSASGMTAQRARAAVLVENLANADTTRTPEGGPYRRKDVLLSSNQELGSFHHLLRREMREPLTGVEVSDVLTDTRDPEKRYVPGHPDADASGYVAFPRVNPAEDMVDLISTSRSFQANVSAMMAVKDMIFRSLDLLR